MQRQYKAGIIGLGGIAGTHFKGLRETGRADIVCGWDPDAEALRKAETEWSLRPLRSAEEVVAADIDLLVIASPGFAHRAYVELAAVAGKPVICEKPVALTLEDALAMRAAVRKAGIPLQVSFNHRNNPPYATMRRLQAEGRIGRTVSAWARLFAPASSARWRAIQASGHWRASLELSGGRINEFCSHTVNWLLWVLGRPRSVYGRALHVTEGFALDDADYALIECEAGAGLLDVHRHAGVPADSHFGILGTGGSILFRDKALTLIRMDEPSENVPVDAQVRSKHQEFIDCLDTGAQPATDIDSAIETLQVCLAFNASAASGEVQRIAP